MQRPTERFSDKADVTALLGAFCFFLSAIEYMLPKPLPFMRLGIANLPILLAVDILPFRWFLVLAAVKVIGMSLISGTLFSYIALFSLFGTLAAALAMWTVRRAGGRFVSQIGVSVAGAMVSNAIQVLIARFLVFRETAWLIAPLFLTMGLITGSALGLFAEHFARVSRWYAKALGHSAPDEGAMVEPLAGGADGSYALPSRGPLARLSAVRASIKENRENKAFSDSGKKAKTAAARVARRAKAEALFSPGALALAGLLIMLAFLSMKGILPKTLMLCLFVVAAWAMGKRFSLLVTLSVSLGIVIANLIVPSGRLLTTIFGLRITEGALLEGIGKALTFEGLMLLSKASIMSGLKLPGRIGRIVAAAFTYYDRIIEYKGKIHPASLAMDADALMIWVWESSETHGASAATESAALAGSTASIGAPPEASGDPATRRKGLAILIGVSFLAWALALYLVGKR
ncbi:MAG TPA: Gx transporter family protein [Rectinemataceae bacterium]|nr:Gx transporter family protein [Rectinemataceae bacterium]